jgi:hypothetical protein
VDAIDVDDVYWVWVAPFLDTFTSATGGYTYEVGPCAAATGTEIERPEGPLSFRSGIDGSSGGTSSVRHAPRALVMPERATVRRGGVR